MDRECIAMKVLFEEPFWIGIVERIGNGTLSVCKITFGPEPKDYEIDEFLRQNFYRLIFSPAVKADITKEVKNPKRIQRKIHQQLENKGIGTKSQQALQLLHEEAKSERKKMSRQQKQDRLQLLYVFQNRSLWSEGFVQLSTDVYWLK